MKLLLSRYLTAGLIVQWAVLLLLIEPAHHHEDHGHHSECSICVVANQPATEALYFSLPPSTSTISTLSFPLTYEPFSAAVLQQRSRSPPLA